MRNLLIVETSQPTTQVLAHFHVRNTGMLHTDPGSDNFAGTLNKFRPRKELLLRRHSLRRLNLVATEGVNEFGCWFHRRTCQIPRIIA